MRVVLTGGGTGGHLYPLVAVSQEIRKIAEEKKIISLDFLYVGAGVSDKSVFDAERISYKIISAGKWRRYASGMNIIDMLFKVPIGVVQSFFILLSYYPDVVFSKGGYGAFPVVVAASILRIPIMIHESDSVPGVVNKKSGRFARRIATSFQMTVASFSLKKTACTGNPIRLGLANGNKDGAKTTFKLVGGRPVILILGGSQGSKAINESFVKILTHLVKKYEVIHQAGTENIKDVIFEAKSNLSFDEQKLYHPVGFMDETDLANAYAASDIVVSRAGAGSIFEIALVGKPSILIPLPNSAGDHQVINAYEYAKGGAAVIIEQPNFTPSIVETKINSILTNEELYKAMSEAAKKFAKPNAARAIAQELFKIAGLA